MGVGVLHALTGLVLNADSWSAILRDGYFNAVRPQFDREAAFWFMMLTPFLVAIGLMVRHALARDDRWLLALAGWTLLGIGTAGAVAIPVSGFWFGIVLSIPLLIHVYRRKPRDARRVLLHRRLA
ncbi:MAG: DUF6463 family protein, partial [candidate division NC10 bacterium]